MATGNVSGGTNEQIFNLPAEIRTVKVIEVEKTVQVPKFEDVIVPKAVFQDVIVTNPILQDKVVEVQSVKVNMEDLTAFIKSEIAKAVKEVVEKMVVTITGTDLKLQVK